MLRVVLVAFAVAAAAALPVKTYSESDAALTTHFGCSSCNLDD